MAGAGFQCFAKLGALTPRIATIRITAWQSALDRAADCQPPPSGLTEPCGRFRPVAIRSQIRALDYSSPEYGNFLCGNPHGKHRDMPTQRYEFDRGGHR
jgi:hypothetical protein